MWWQLGKDWSDWEKREADCNVRRPGETLSLIGAERTFKSHSHTRSGLIWELEEIHCLSGHQMWEGEVSVFVLWERRPKQNIRILVMGWHFNYDVSSSFCVGGQFLRVVLAGESRNYKDQIVWNKTEYIRLRMLTM